MIKNIWNWFFGRLSNRIAIIFLVIVQFALIAAVFKLFNVVSLEAFTTSAFTWGITMITTMLIGMKSMNYLMSHAYKFEIEKEICDKQIIETLKKQKSELDNQIQELKGEVALRNDEIETMKQAQQLVANYENSRQLQILTVSKSGNIVREEELYPLKECNAFKENFPQKSYLFGLFSRDITSDDNWRVFYTDNKLYKYGVGIKLDNVYYAVDPDTNIIYFKNVELSRLVRHAKDYVGYIPDKNLTNHVWIVQRDRKTNYKLINDQQHNDFKIHYRGFQQDSAGQAIQTAIDNLCAFYTEGLHNILISRYGNIIRFVKNEENIDYLEWKTLSEGLRTSKDVRTFMNDLYLTFDAMELCADNNHYLDSALIPE